MSRRINKVLKERLDAANKTVCLQTEEIERLKKAISIQKIAINSLEIKEKELSDKIYSLCSIAIEQTKLNNENYEAWLNEHKLNGKLSIGLTVMSIIIIGLIFTLIGVLR